MAITTAIASATVGRPWGLCLLPQLGPPSDDLDGWKRRPAPAFQKMERILIPAITFCVLLDLYLHLYVYLSLSLFSTGTGLLTKTTVQSLP